MRRRRNWSFCHKALCHTFSHVSSDCFFFFSGLSKSEFLHTSKVVAVLVACEHCEEVSTDRNKLPILGLNGIQAFKLSKSIYIFNFLIITVTVRFSA